MKLWTLVLVLAALALLSTACSSSDDETADVATTTTDVAEAEEPEPPAAEVDEADDKTAVPEETPTAETTTTLTPNDPGGLEYPWHAKGTVHTDPVAAVQEFVDFVNFTEGTTLSEFRQGDSRSGEIEIDPPPPGSDPITEDLQSLSQGTDFSTTAFVRLNDDDHWVVIGAASLAVVVNEPVSDATASSPLDVHFDYNAAEDGVVMQLWPEGAAAPVVDEMVTSGSGVFAKDIWDVTVEWDSATTGPAVAIFRSASGLVRPEWTDEAGWDDLVARGMTTRAVTTLRLNLDS